MAITVKSLFQQLWHDVTSESPGEELLETGKFLRAAVHEGTKQSAGALRGNVEHAEPVLEEKKDG